MQGASDPSAFLQWQKEMKEKDLQEALAQMEYRRLEGKIIHKEALLAQQRVIELNQHKALVKKEEVIYHVLISFSIYRICTFVIWPIWLSQTAELMRRYAEKRLKEEKEMRELVQLVADGHKNSKAAKVKLQEIKRRIGVFPFFPDLPHVI